MNRVEAAHIGKRLTEEARSLGLPTVPIFQFPPELAEGRQRAVRRAPDRSIYAVAVLITGRPDVDVVHDMVEGILVANPAHDAAARPALELAAAELLTHQQQKERRDGKR